MQVCTCVLVCTGVQVYTCVCTGVYLCLSVYWCMSVSVYWCTDVFRWVCTGLLSSVNVALYVDLYKCDAHARAANILVKTNKIWKLKKDEKMSTNDRD